VKRARERATGSIEQKQQSSDLARDRCETRPDGAERRYEDDEHGKVHGE
jgi:hypothetical protein